MAKAKRSMRTALSEFLAIVFRRSAGWRTVAAASTLLVAGCVVKGELPDETANLKVVVTLEDGSALPGSDAPMPILTKGMSRKFKVSVEAKLMSGATDTQFNGYVRLSVHPGAVVSVQGDEALVAGRNVMMTNGRSPDLVVEVTDTFGESHIWAEDAGYVPADPSKPPACSNGKDDDGDGMIDFPSDTGCAFANDDTEVSGTYASGASAALNFSLPTLQDIQGRGAQTPLESEQVQVAASSPQKLIVTRISSDGFYVTDLGADSTVGYNHLFAFNFSPPWNMRICDQVVYLGGTLSEFYGYTELNFPTYKLHEWRFPSESTVNDGDCLVPEPNEITSSHLMDSATAQLVLEKWEASLVRVQGARIASLFSQGNAVKISGGWHFDAASGGGVELRPERRRRDHLRRRG